MALSQVFPEFECVVDVVDEGKVIPRARAAEVVSFRAGADLRRLIDVVAVTRFVRVEAAPAAGKSTVFPVELAKATGELVVLVEPGPLLAEAHYRYLRNFDPRVSIVREVLDPWPDSGVVVVSAGCVVASWLTQGRIVVPRCYLLQDESHESGAASAALRALAHVSHDIISYVQLTATSDPDGARRMEAKGKVSDSAYDPAAFEDPWSVEESGAPWACDSLTRNILIFEDDDERAQTLLQAYNMNGVKAYRLHARMSARVFVDILDMLDNPSISVYALIADSSFRSGFTFPVATIVDSGIVKRVTVNERGRPVWSTRRIYEFERVQARARGGRLDGLHTRYWAPLGAFEKRMCDLEQTDAEALAVICRLLGYRVPGEIKEAVMATGPLPIFPAQALRGKVPLASLPSYQLRPVGERPSHAVGEVLLDPPAAPSASTTSVAMGDDVFALAEASDVLRSAMSEEVREVEPLDLNTYYGSVGLVTTDVLCVGLPEGAMSVRRLMMADATKTLHLAWSPYVRSVAINALMLSRSMALVELRGITRCLAEVRRLPQTKEAHALQHWAVRVAERLTVVVSEVKQLSDLLVSLARGFCHYEKCGDMFDAEEGSVLGYYSSEFQNIAEKTLPLSDELVGGVRAWAGNVWSVDGASDDVRREKLALGKGQTRAVKLAAYFSGYGHRPVRGRGWSSSSSGS